MNPEIISYILPQREPRIEILIMGAGDDDVVVGAQFDPLNRLGEPVSAADPAEVVWETLSPSVTSQCRSGGCPSQSEMQTLFLSISLASKNSTALREDRRCVATIRARS